ncbi:MAG: elongation factor P [Candidatus Melainabacteria bacterium]|mgnify:CR=1 FL=1|nr:elongation factor P [Candidatus Melainabacteria bacterium]
MISSNDFRPGVTIFYNNGIWAIVDAMHVKPGKGSAFVRTKMKNVENGSVLENTFRAGEKVPQAIIEKDDMQYLFKSGDNFTMMNTSTYEQTEMEEGKIGSQAEFLKEGLEGITVMKYDGRVIGVELPNSVELEIKDCAPDERGDTSSGGGKPATLETGAVITVPFHIKIGDTVKVDTRTRKYVTRV